LAKDTEMEKTSEIRNFFQLPWFKRNIKLITFILASSNIGNMMKTGSIGVDKYNRPSVGEQKQ